MAVSSHLRALLALHPLPIEYEAGWTPEPGCTLCVGGKKKALLPMPVLERRLLGRPIRSLDTVPPELT